MIERVKDMGSAAVGLSLLMAGRGMAACALATALSAGSASIANEAAAA